MSEWFETLEGLNDQAWQLLMRGAADSRSDMHTPVLATVDEDGAPSARMVILRRAAPSEAVLEVHTDHASAKIAQLTADPRASLMFWAPKRSLQIRAALRVEILSGDRVSDIWTDLSETARRNYGGRPTPGTPIDSPADYRETAERDRFAVLRGHITRLELLHLGETHHRAVYAAPDFAGGWIAP